MELSLEYEATSIAPKRDSQFAHTEGRTLNLKYHLNTTYQRSIRHTHTETHTHTHTHKVSNLYGL